jgi:ferrous iron transport protein B
MSEITKEILVALAGNPNSGKSTIFNNLTGSRQHVGNYPGVTVEKKKGKTNYKGYKITFVDLPGTYSLSASSEDEMVARDFIVYEKPDVVIHVVDATNLERNLYFYTQLSEQNVPIILAMNMSDIVDSKGYTIDYGKLAKNLGKPVIATVGSKNKGMDKLLATVIDVYETKIKLGQTKVDYGEEINLECSKLAKLLANDKNKLNRYPPEWFAIKLLEQGQTVTNLIKNFSGYTEIAKQLEESHHHLRQHFGDDTEVLIADRRYGFVSGVCKEVIRQTAEKRYDFSDKIDKVIMNRFLGLPIFAFVMYGIFKFTFTFSEPVVGWFEKFFAWIVWSIIPEGLIQSFVVDGIIGGVGGVLGFFPLVLFMFFAIAFFEDSGYMARAAFIMDRIMHKFGLHGKSFLPMMISTNGCAVLGIMATRTLDSKKDRLITMMIIPFMICGAKLPIFALFIGAFFPAKYGADIMFFMYALSIVIAFGSAWILKTFVFRGEAAHFVMELPPYRMPTIQGLFLKMWERGWLYIRKAGSIIFLISVLIWFGFTFPRVNTEKMVSGETAAAMQMEQSFAGMVGKFIEPIMKPLGMDWRSSVALLAGIAAKEVVVSAFGTVYSLGEVDPEKTYSLKESLQNDPSWSPLKALAFLMFSLIYLPCFAAIAIFYRESGSRLKWTSFLIFWTTVMAWCVSFIVYQGGKILGI